MSAANEQTEPKKADLLRIAEEDSHRPETPETSIVVDVDNGEPTGKVKNELNFYELWAHSHWRQFTSLMPGNKSTK